MAHEDKHKIVLNEEINLRLGKTTISSESLAQIVYFQDAVSAQVEAQLVDSNWPQYPGQQFRSCKVCQQGHFH